MSIVNKRFKSNILAAILLGGVLAQTSGAAILNYQLAGNVEFDGWNRLTAGTPGLTEAVLSTAPGFGSNEAGSGDATLLRLTGGHFPASASLYSFGSNSTFRIADTVSLADVRTVVFTIETWHTGGDGSTPAGAVVSGPTLNYNSGSQALSATYLGPVSVGAVDFGGPVATFAHTFQWDLSAIGDAVTSYDVTWTHLVHSGVVRLQLESADQFSVAAVPEPGTAGFAALAFAGLLLGNRKRR